MFNVRRSLGERATPRMIEFGAVYRRCPAMHQVAMDIALLTGLRREDILKLDRNSDTEAGLLVHTGKTGKPLLFKWSDELHAAVDRAWTMQPKLRRHLICTRGGKQYTGDGFSVIWRRARDRAIEEENCFSLFPSTIFGEVRE